jgi:hypothetical protein
LTAGLLRGLFPTADPPWRTTVGVVWHDEGAWTHNARNRALFGEWRLDAWNPIFIAPVFTILEYGSFATFGVGTWQARLVSQTMGLLAVMALGLGVARLGAGTGSPRSRTRGDTGAAAGAGSAWLDPRRTAGLVAAAWLATNYVAVMYDRAAIMESTMAAFVVLGWYGFVRAQRDGVWGLFAGTAAMLAYLTKAAAAFFIVAMAVTCVWSLIAEPRDGNSDSDSSGRLRMRLGRLFRWNTYRLTTRQRHPSTDARLDRGPGIGTQAGGGTPSDAAAWPDEFEAARVAAVWTLLGLTIAGLLAIAVVIAPYWTEYRFYNWQMSVTRKPSYDLRSILDRVSWMGILHDVFTRMWFVWIVGLIAWAGRLARWFDRGIAPAERLLVLWIGIGGLELLVHDVGNERRFVFLIPALVALAAIAIVRDRRLLPPAIAAIPRAKALVALPFVLYLLYVVSAPIARLTAIYEVKPAVRLAAALAVAATALLYLTWPRIPRWLAGAAVPRPGPSSSSEIAMTAIGMASNGTPPAAGWPRIAAPRATIALALLVAAGNVAQFTQWAAGRTYANVEASRELGRLLPPGTLVHGKLANGLALENRIRPVFVGRNFGNYDDRLTRNDVPYVLTYVAPREGYEGPVILDVLHAYPARRILRTFEVRESSAGYDRAALVEKGPPAIAPPALMTAERP